MPGRTWKAREADGYKYGFNGKENDTETSLQDYGFRMYDPLIARFISVDPLSKSYPWYTPYQFAGNMPAIAIDLDGLEEYIMIKEFAKSAYGDYQYVTRTTYKEVGWTLWGLEIVETKFSWGGKVYTPNSEHTIRGRDGRGVRPGKEGNFSGVYTMTESDLSKLFAYGLDVINEYGSIDGAYWNESVGDNAKLDFKFTLFEVLGVENNMLIEVNGVTYNPNEAGNFLWSALNEYADEVTDFSSLLDPSTLAQLGTLPQLRRDEPHEQKACDDGEDYGIKLSEDMDFNQKVYNQVKDKKVFDEDYVSEPKK